MNKFEKPQQEQSGNIPEFIEIGEPNDVSSDFIDEEGKDSLLEIKK